MATNERFALQQLTPIEWIVIDTNRESDDPYRTVACIYETDRAGYDVIWLHDLGLHRTYRSPREVLHDIQQASGRPTRVPSRKPVPIPHRPPVRRARPAGAAALASI